MRSFTPFAHIRCHPMRIGQEMLVRLTGSAVDLAKIARLNLTANRRAGAQSQKPLQTSFTFDLRRPKSRCALSVAVEKLESELWWWE